MLRTLLLLLCSFLAACRPAGADVAPALRTATEAQSALAVHAALEGLIQAGVASERDREYAYESVQGWDDGTAEYAFARAALAGRLAQSRGLSALGLVKEAEQWAITSIERNPEYADGAARRMLGTLYALAGNHVEHGDSEEGLSMLEQLADEYPDQAVNHLRLGEAFVSLGDPEGGFDALCRAHRGREQLTREEQELLTQLIADAGGMEALRCAGD